MRRLPRTTSGIIRIARSWARSPSPSWKPTQSTTPWRSALAATIWTVDARREAQPTAFSLSFWRKPTTAGRSFSTTPTRHGQAVPSDRHDLLLLSLEHLVNPLDLRVRELLNLLVRAFLIIGRDQLVLHRLLHLVVAVPANVAD